MALSRALSIGLMQGGADLGTALIQAYSASQGRKARAAAEERKRQLAEYESSTDALLKAKGSPEFAPDTYNRKQTDAFGNEVQVQDVRLPSQVSDQIEQLFLGDKAGELRQLRSSADMAVGESARNKANSAIAKFQEANASQMDALRKGRGDLAQPASTLFQIGGQMQAPESAGSAQRIQQLLMSGTLPPDIQSRVLGMLPELQDESQAERDRGRVEALLQARQMAVQNQDVGRLTQIDAALSEYEGALDDATIQQQLSGGLPAGHPKAFPVHPAFGGNGLEQAIAQSQKLRAPMQDKYSFVLGGKQPSRGFPSASEESMFDKVAADLPPDQQFALLETFAKEREAGGNLFTAMEKDQKMGANASRKYRENAAVEAFQKNREVAAQRKEPFRLRGNSSKSNSWGAFYTTRAAAEKAGLNPSQADFVGAMAMYSGHTPLGSDTGKLTALAKAGPQEFFRVASEMGLSPAEKYSVAKLRSIYSLGSAEEVKLAQAEAPSTKDTVVKSISGLVSLLPKDEAVLAGLGAIMGKDLTGGFEFGGGADTLPPDPTGASAGVRPSVMDTRRRQVEDLIQQDASLGIPGLP